MMKRRVDSWRLALLVGIPLAIFAVIGYRVLTVAYVHHADYSSQLARLRSTSGKELVRGAITLTDQDGIDGHVVATTKGFPILTVHANAIPSQERERASRLVRDLADVSEEQAHERVYADSDLALPIGEYLDEQEWETYREADMPGLDVVQVTDRFYPDGVLAADVIGFFGFDPQGRHGQYGVEAFYEQELAGRTERTGGISARGLITSLFGLLGLSDEPARVARTVASDVVLTLDRNVQAFAEETLEAVLERYDASAGSVIVQDVTTGALVAMADSPSFDPNRYGLAPAEAYLNAPAQRAFEPGSSFKPFTMAIGLDTGVVGANTTYTDTGSTQVAGYTIRNFTNEPFGTVTMSQVLEKSINTGTMFVQRRVGNDQFLEYLINFGFGQRTGIDLPGEATGNLSNLYTGRAINFQTASFGQGISVTPVQLAMGYSAIANGGTLLRPYVVERIISDGEVTYRAEPEVVGIPIRTTTAADLRTMLTGVVDRGFDKARIPRYHVAGKTGTAQIADPQGGYLEDEYIHSFAGFIPSTDDARFTIVIVMERPQGVTFASDSLSSVFKDIAQFLINYYRIPPTR